MNYENVLKTYDEVNNWLKGNNLEKLAFDTETSDLNCYKMEVMGLSLFNGINVCYIDLYENVYRTRILDLLKLFQQNN